MGIIILLVLVVIGVSILITQLHYKNKKLTKYHTACNARFREGVFQNLDGSIYQDVYLVHFDKNKIISKNIETILREKIINAVVRSVHGVVNTTAAFALEEFRRAYVYYTKDSKFENTKNLITTHCIVQTDLHMWKLTNDYIAKVASYDELWDLYLYLHSPGMYTWKSDQKWPIGLTMLSEYMQGSVQFASLTTVMRDRMKMISKKDSEVICNLDEYEHYVDIYERKFVDDTVRSRVQLKLELIGEKAAENIVKKTNVDKSKTFLDALDKVNLLTPIGPK
jgi:hypothetical protein